MTRISLGFLVATPDGKPGTPFPGVASAAVIGTAVLLLTPLAVRFAFPAAEKYYLHLLIQILIWSFIYTGWSLMGRFGLTSLGHGAFTGIGAYVTVLLWNYAGVTPA